jgi:hypothetical protein
MRRFFLAAAAALTMAFGAAPAFAAYPSAIGGTWNGFVGQTPLKITISMLFTTGICREFSSTLADASVVFGYYCPGTGRINFVRENALHVTQETFSGNLAQVGSTNRMAGTMINLNFPGNEAGWYLTK